MAFSPIQVEDLQYLTQILGSFSAVISTEEAVVVADRILEPATITSLNKTMKDASDAIDAIVLASQVPIPV